MNSVSAEPTWNHRVIKTPDPLSESGSNFAIHEVHYDGSGVPVSYTEAVITDGDSIAEMVRQMASMSQALSRPVLTPADFPVAGHPACANDQAVSHGQALVA